MGIMEKKMETTIMGYIGIISYNNMDITDYPTASRCVLSARPRAAMKQQVSSSRLFPLLAKGQGNCYHARPGLRRRH